ncbi:unnamed protein product, partial [marine sediment metagenome]
DLDSVVQAMKDNHPYEEPAYDIYKLATRNLKLLHLLLITHYSN